MAYKDCIHKNIWKLKQYPSIHQMAHSAAIFSTNSVGIARFHSTVRASHQNRAPTVSSNGVISRRNLSLGLVAGTLLGVSDGDRSARAAGRRAPAPPPTEKKDPNLSGLQAKILASKRRKEAMKQEIAKLRQKGKTAQDTP